MWEARCAATIATVLGSDLGSHGAVPDEMADEAGVALRPGPPAVREDAAAAGGTTRGDGVDLVEQVGVGGEPGDVALDQLEPEAAVADDAVPVGHQVVLGHRRDGGQVLLAEGVRVDPGEPLAVPRRRRLGHPQQVAQALGALLPQPLCLQQISSPF